MFKISVITCPEEDYVGDYVFGKNLIQVGSSPDCDLMLPGDKVASRHLFIETVDGQLLAHVGMDKQEFWVDGKIVTKFKFLNPESVIKVGQCEFHVTESAFSQWKDKRETMNKNTDELIRGKSKLLSYVKLLQEKL